MSEIATAMDLILKTRELADALQALRLPSGCTHAYNPLTYMRAAHEAWLDLFTEEVETGEYDGREPISEMRAMPRPYLIVGMNPGPWGMVQTGVPFGDVPNAKRILAIGEARHMRFAPAPFAAHDKRPVYGFACTRVEQSGDRLWGGLADIWCETRDPMHLCTSPDERLCDVVTDCFALNYCPLAWFAADGTNVTPEMLAPKTREGKSNPYHDPGLLAQLDLVVAPYLLQVMNAMRTRVVLAVGKYAERKTTAIVSTLPPSARPKVVYLQHPSPLATRSANEWTTKARDAMVTAGVMPHQMRGGR